MEEPVSAAWCDCGVAPRYVRGPATLLDYPGGCEFPDGICTVRAHRLTVHVDCGRPLAVRFCSCLPSGYEFDEARGWWVHYVCGWPTRAWYEAAGRPAPENLCGFRPVTLHEYPVVPHKPKKVYEKLTQERQRLNDSYAGEWVRD